MTTMKDKELRSGMNLLDWRGDVRGRITGVALTSADLYVSISLDDGNTMYFRTHADVEVSM